MTDLFGTNTAPTIGLGIRIETVEEFNRRALIALTNVSFGQNTQAPGIVSSCRIAFNAGRPLTERQQGALYSIVHRYRKQIMDVLCTEFAAQHIQGAD